MHPRCWLPRRSWRLEHNQCRSLSYFRRALNSIRRFDTTHSLARPSVLLLRSARFSTWIVDKAVYDESTGSSCAVLTALHHMWAVCLARNWRLMAVTIELQNLGDAQRCRDITAYLEHAFSSREGKWRVS